MGFKDYYQILQVNRTASEEEIRQAFRRLAKRFHPDSNPDERARAIFNEINEAHQVLSDAQKRKNYDFQYTLLLQFLQQNGNVPHPGMGAARTRRQFREPPKVSRALKIYANVAQVFTFMALLFSITLLTDYLLPRKPYVEMVNGYGELEDQSKGYRVHTMHSDFQVEKDVANYMQLGELIGIYRTKLYAIVDQISVREQGEIVLMKPMTNLYSGPFWALALMLWTPLFFLPRHDVILRSCSGTFNLLLAYIMLQILIISY
ncbi:MAG: J domain-containing protein [Bacteroidota bacterium]